MTDAHDRMIEYVQTFVNFPVPRAWIAKTDIVMPPEDERAILIGERFNSDDGFTQEQYFHIVTPCLMWKGWNNGKGHGKCRVNGSARYTHRRAFELHNGLTLATDDIVDHLCRNRPCWNPTHLENTTMRINTERGLGVHNQFKLADWYAERGRARQEPLDHFSQAAADWCAERSASG